jgi:pimeloyl-ACP methyl ester carboxylesterase
MIDKKFARLAAGAKVTAARTSRISHLDLGSGPAVLLIHGGHGGWYHWIENVEALARTRRVIAPDMPGFGASSALPDTLSLPRLSDELFGLLDSLGIEQVDLVAFSFGSCVAAWMADTAPGRVRSLALVNPAGMGPVSPLLVDIQARAAAQAREQGIARGIDVSMQEIMLSDPARWVPGLTALMEQHVRATRTVTRPIARTNPTRALLSRVQVPLWLALGTRDPHQLHELDDRAQWAASLHPGNEVHRHPAAHWLQFEVPQWFNEHVARFLDRTALSRPTSDAQP